MSYGKTLDEVLGLLAATPMLTPSWLMIFYHDRSLINDVCFEQILALSLFASLSGHTILPNLFVDTPNGYPKSIKLVVTL